jgi:hypothetical protein
VRQLLDKMLEHEILCLLVCMINYDFKHSGFDRLLPDDDCLIAIKIWTTPHSLPYIVVDSESRAKARSRLLVRSRG